MGRISYQNILFSAPNRMLRVCAVALILVAPPGAVEAQGPDAFIGLFADSLRQHDAYCSFEGEQAVIELWVYCYPSIRGQSGAEYRIEYPSNVIPSPIIPNGEIVSFHSGDPATGVNVLYGECQWTTNWCSHQFLVLTSHEPTIIDIVPVRFRNCEPGYVHEPAKRWMELYLNYEEGGGAGARRCRPPVGIITDNEESSWGAIKACMRAVQR